MSSKSVFTDDDYPQPPAEARQAKFTRERDKAERLERRAKRVRAVYQLERRCYESMRSGTDSNYSPSRKFDTNGTWTKVARELHKNKVDPVIYVGNIFAKLRTLPAAPPTPAQLLSGQFAAMYRDYSKGTVARAKRQLMVNVEYSHARIVVSQSVNGLTMLDATYRLLGDPRNSLDPLFRYCFAVSMMTKEKRFCSIAKLYRMSAILQYVHDRAGYDEIWCDRMPSWFPQKALAAYEELM